MYVCVYIYAYFYTPPESLASQLLPIFISVLLFSSPSLSLTHTPTPHLPLPSRAFNPNQRLSVSLFTAISPQRYTPRTPLIMPKVRDQPQESLPHFAISSETNV